MNKKEKEGGRESIPQKSLPSGKNNSNQVSVTAVLTPQIYKPYIDWVE